MIFENILNILHYFNYFYEKKWYVNIDNEFSNKFLFEYSFNIVNIQREN